MVVFTSGPVITGAPLTCGRAEESARLMKIRARTTGLPPESTTEPRTTPGMVAAARRQPDKAQIKTNAFLIA
jgi:hypothetical protein